MDKKNILIFDEQGFFYGSTQKLLRQMAKILAAEFNVYFAYGNGRDEEKVKDLEGSGITIVDNNFTYRQNREPYKLVGMQPSISEIVEKYHIHCVYCVVFAHYQFPINSIPAGIPLVLISPFGHYASNGNVVKTYVSGRDNEQRLIKRGVKTAEVFFNPLEDFPPEFLQKPAIIDQVIFGRIGRGEDNIFDPISVKAFKKLEEKYQDQVKYIVVNPPPAWVKLAKDLQIQNMEFRPAITNAADLAKFYQQIDVLAHARKDGETVGMAIGEAMLAGNPILTHKSHHHNNHLELLDKSYARWCEADDIEDYYQNMLWIVEHKEKIREMGQLARKKSLSVFGLNSLAPKIIADFKEACRHYYHGSGLGRLKGELVLGFENLKSMPFFVGKLITYYFPSAYKVLRNFFYE